MTQKQVTDSRGRRHTVKLDVVRNGIVDMKKLKESEKGKIPLRISRQTTIYVSPEKCNEQYAHEYRKRMGIK